MPRLFLIVMTCLLMFSRHSGAADAGPKFDGHREKSGANVEKAALNKANEMIAKTGCSISYVDFGIMTSHPTTHLCAYLNGYAFWAESPKGAKDRRFISIQITSDGKLTKMVDQSSDTALLTETVKKALATEVEGVKSKGSFKLSSEKPWIIKTTENEKTTYSISMLNTSKSEYMLFIIGEDGKVTDTKTGHACND
jgi:hypothetical protein